MYVHLTFVFGFPQWPHSNFRWRWAAIILFDQLIEMLGSCDTGTRTPWVDVEGVWHSWCQSTTNLSSFFEAFFKQLNFGFWFNHVEIFLQNLKNRAAQTILSTPWKFNIEFAPENGQPCFKRKGSSSFAINFSGANMANGFFTSWVFLQRFQNWDVWHLDFADFHLIRGLALVVCGQRLPPS